MIGSTTRTWLAALCFVSAGCAVTPSERGDAESTGTADEAILIKLQHVSLALQASVHRVATASGSFGIKEVQYLSFHVANTGTTNAAPSQIAITCSVTSTPLNFSPLCVAQPIIVGLPAIPAGGFADFSWPNRALEIGAGTDSNVWTPSGMALDETITVSVQSSSQIVDPTIGTVVLHDSCDGNAACAAIPVSPSPSPSARGLLGTPLQFGYLYSYFEPTWLSIYALTSGAVIAQLDSGVVVHGGEPLRVDSALLEASAGGWSGTGVASGEPVRVYLDNVLVSNVTVPGSGTVASTYVNAPPYDTATHTLRVTFAGDSSATLPAPLAPTVSRTYSFTLVP